jgi:hypothetical protein
MQSNNILRVMNLNILILLWISRKSQVLLKKFTAVLLEKGRSNVLKSPKFFK